MKNKLIIALLLTLILAFGALTACVNGDSFTVTFAGEGVNVPSQKVANGGLAVEPKDPERDGYTFKHWYLTDENTPYSFATPVTGDITLNAYWEQDGSAQHTVTFAGEGVNVPSQKVANGGLAVEPKDPERDGYTFKHWYLTDENTPYSFATPVTGDITLNAYWEDGDGPVSDKITGQGTKESPYVLSNSAHLIQIASAVNGGDEDYAEAYYKLGADIDLQGVDYKPIGVVDHPFKGVFDGNGKTLSNLSFHPLIRTDGVKLYGIFGMTDTAEISNLTVENVSFNVQSYRDGSGTGVYIGAIAGYASLTQFTNIRVKASVATFLMAGNEANIGGIAGWYSCESNSSAYIAYVENCSAEVEMGLIEQDGEKGSLETARVGGLFGAIKTRNCSVAVLNCATRGKIYGGQYVGGIAGYAGSLVSVIDCINTASVEATSTEVCYAGGILGCAMGDNLIMDCASTGSVKALKAGSNVYNYKSYAGGVAGYAESDDYEYYYSAGTSVINCYYTEQAVGADVITTLGSSDYASGFFKRLSNVLPLLHWNSECWTTDNSAIVPSGITAGSASDKYSLTLVSQGSDNVVIDKLTDTGTGYSLVGSLDDLQAVDGKVFWNWELSDGVNYKFYAPVCKDITLNARWQSVQAIVGSYVGTGTLHETVNAGSIILFENGSLQWVTDSVITGVYKFDGTRILMSINNDAGDVSGVVSGTNITFYVDAGMSGTVTYSFDAYSPKLIGEYMSESGNLLTFAGTDRVSYENGSVNNGAYFSGNYSVVDDTTLNVEFSRLNGYGISASRVVIQDDGSLTLYYSVGGDNRTENFAKIGAVDYGSQGFVGEYSYVSVSSYTHASKMRLKLDSDGTARIISDYSETLGRYYYIANSNTIKLICSGYVSNFTYDVDKDIAYGVLLLGGSALKPIVLTKIDRGIQSVYTNYEYVYKGPNYDYVFVYVLPDANYVFINTDYRPELAITTELGEGKDVAIDGIKYRIFDMELKTVYDEEGDYIYSDSAIHLDGIDRAEIDGQSYYYFAHKDDCVVDIIFGEELISFNWLNARQNNGVAVQLQLDGYQGIWYLAGSYTDDAGEKVNDPYHDMLVIDGSGHTAMFYRRDVESAYRLNWSPWGTYTVTSYGICATFNEYHANYKFNFYYDKKVAVSPDYSDKLLPFVVKGYSGETTPPAFPSAKAGSYVYGSDSDRLVLNLRADLTGTYAGNPIYNVMYDGESKLFFTANGLNYEFTLTSNGGSLKQTGDISGSALDFVLSGAVAEVIPSAVCGMWTGEFKGYGVGANDIRGFSIESDGTVYYYSNVTSGSKTQMKDVAYDYATNTLTFSDNGDFSWTLVYNVEDCEINVEGKNSENTPITALLTKSEQQS